MLDRAATAAANLEGLLGWQHRIATGDHAATDVVKVWVERIAHMEEWPRLAVAVRAGFSAHIPAEHCGLPVMPRPWPHELQPGPPEAA
jgi:hypothetical protein